MCTCTQMTWILRFPTALFVSSNGKMWNFPFSFNGLLTHCMMETSRLFIVSVFFVLSFLASQLDSVNAENELAKAKGEAITLLPSTTVSPAMSSSLKTSTNSTGNDNTWTYGVLYDKGMLRRSFYVLIGITAFAIIFFVYRSIRSRRRQRTKKYGVLATRGSDMELRPLDQEDDEEDMTVFDVNSK